MDSVIRKVLIVDNDADTLDAMQEIFGSEGFEVHTTTDSADVFSVIESYQPDIVLIDYLLDGINGGEICHQIKVDPKTSHLPVIIISGHSRVLKSLGFYGCDAFIEKPFDMYDLLDRVAGLLQHRAQA